MNELMLIEFKAKAKKLLDWIIIRQCNICITYTNDSLDKNWARIRSKDYTAEGMRRIQRTIEETTLHQQSYRMLLDLYSKDWIILDYETSGELLQINRYSLVPGFFNELATENIHRVLGRIFPMTIDLATPPNTP